MTNKHTLFPKVEDYYADLVNQLGTAKERISLMYLAFDTGVWAKKIATILCAKTEAGLQVRLIIDTLGQIADKPRHLLKNHEMLKFLGEHGVEMNILRPSIPDLSSRNRMHCKIAAIDDRTVFIGGSNIGYYYTTWNDTNLRVDGKLGDTFHTIYDYLCSFSWGKQADCLKLNLTNLWAGDSEPSASRLVSPAKRDFPASRNSLLHL